MTTETWVDPLSVSPIDGRGVAKALADAFDRTERLVLVDLETITSGSRAIGDLWRRTLDTRTEVVTAGELIDALNDATQVIFLDVRRESDPSQELYIDDGDLIDNTLPRR